MGENSVKKWYFCTFIHALVCMIMLIVSTATPNWITGEVYRFIDNSDPVLDSILNDTSGSVYFGIINGYKEFNYGFGTRESQSYTVFEEHEGVYPTWLPILVIVCMVISAVFALVATIFGMVNSITVPIETVHGPKGLFYWNGFGGAFSAIALFTYVGLYYETLQFNVLNDVDTKAPNYFVTESADYGYSFWLLVVTFGLFSINIILLIIAHLISDPNFQWRKKAEQESNQQTSEVGLGIMY
ncbi:clarin-3-like isoform X2 [Anneissia japonica]|uniref:clarin-3-like isoform X2 n=1 Tax=Anneissia japonica TaxID=1529436 RepID=UPI001425AB8F|nr:clarin-3-like isoform X2 [Anneissia japonica]